MFWRADFWCLGVVAGQASEADVQAFLLQTHSVGQVACSRGSASSSTNESARLKNLSKALRGTKVLWFGAFQIIRPLTKCYVWLWFGKKELPAQNFILDGVCQALYQPFPQPRSLMEVARTRLARNSNTELHEILKQHTQFHLNFR